MSSKPKAQPAAHETTEASRPLALVTGAGRGIGRAIAEGLARAGFDLELTNLDPKELEDVMKILPPTCKARGFAFDLRDRAAIDQWTTELKSRHEVIHALVHNAGVAGPDPEDDEACLEHLEELLAVNVTAPMLLTQALLDLIPQDGGGRIVVIASVLGKMGVPGFSAYCSSKHAAIGLTRSLALELARKKITVNAVCPGWTDTAMALQGFESIAGVLDETDPARRQAEAAKARQQVEADLPLGRIVQPAEVAAMVEFLLSKGAAAMTGQALTMSAGDLQR